MKQLNYFLLIILFISFQNCNNDDVNSTDQPDPETGINDELFKSENFGSMTSGDFIGLITDASGVNMPGVLVTVGTNSATTDHNGIFIINNADVYENFAYIKATKEGYIKASRVVIPKENGVNNIRIALLKKDVTETVSSGEVSQVSLPNGAKVSFDGNFITENGNPYSGQVDVVLHYLAPNSLNLFLQMPGSLFAQTLTNDARSLETYGMLSVNLFSPSGEPLNINEDNPATLEFPVDASQTSIAPQTINLWYFDEEQGYWKEQGQATKVGNKYVGEVTHFSWWNCDLPLNYVNLCFTLSPNNTDASTYYQVKIQRQTNNQVIFYGNVLSNEGSECGLIPEGEQVKISIYSTSETCSGELIHDQVVGGYTSNTEIDISFNEEISTTTLTGTAFNCDGNPITNGYLIVDNQVALSITDGSINYGIQHCSSVTTDILIFDLDTNQWTVANGVTMNGATIDLGMLNSCQATGGVYEGDVILLSQAEVDAFGLFGYNNINGCVLIGGSIDSDIIDLTPLASLETVSCLQIAHNPNLANLDGLNNINTISNGLYIAENASLNSLEVLNNLNNIGGGITIQNCNSLTSIVSNSFSSMELSLYIINNENLNSIEFNTLTDVRTLQIINNPNLSSISFSSLISTELDFNINNNDSLTTLGDFNNLNSIGSLDILNNNSLLNLNAINSVTGEIKGIDIANNSSLNSIEGLINITHITGNAGRLFIFNNATLSSLYGLNNIVDAASLDIANNGALVSLDGLESFMSLNGNSNGLNAFLSIDANSQLSDYCALQNLFTNGNYSLENIFISNNAFNPTVQNIIDGNCSQ
jgi:hypothetical protein